MARNCSLNNREEGLSSQNPHQRFLSFVRDSRQNPVVLLLLSPGLSGWEVGQRLGRGGEDHVRWCMCPDRLQVRLLQQVDVAKVWEREAPWGGLKVGVPSGSC